MIRLKARKDLDVCLILGAKKAVVIAIQAFEQPSLKQLDLIPLG